MLNLIFLKGWQNTIDLGVAAGMIILFAYWTFHLGLCLMGWLHTLYFKIRCRQITRNIIKLQRKIDNGRHTLFTRHTPPWH